jgi:PST family polysaccharide transporter
MMPDSNTGLKVWLSRLVSYAKAVEFGKLSRRMVGLVLLRLVAMLATFVGSVWALRCLGAEQAGVSGFVLAVAQQAVLISAILPNNFLVREVKHRHSRSLVIQSILLQRLAFSLVITLFGGVALAIARPEGSWFLAYLFACPLVVLLAVRCQWYLQAVEDQLSLYRNQCYGAVLAMVLYFAFFRPGTPAYYEVLVALMSAGLVSWLNFRIIRPSITEAFDLSGAISYLKTAMVRARWLYITSLFIYFYVSFQVPLVGLLLDVKSMGIYRAAFLAVSAVHAFSLIVPLVLYPRFIEWHRLGERILWRRQIAIFLALMVLGLFVCALAAIVSPVLFPMVFGEEYAGATWPFVILLLSKLMVVLNGIFAYGLWAQRADKSMFWITSVAAVTSIVLSIWLVPQYGVVAAAIVAVIAEVIVLVLTAVESRRRLNNVKIL